MAQLADEPHGEMKMVAAEGGKPRLRFDRRPEKGCCCWTDYQNDVA
jgi:hypothetical protein